MRRLPVLAAVLALLGWALAAPALAHNISGKDAAFVASSAGAHIGPFLYLGAKHMVTGYDHLLFILGVVFFLYRLTHVALYVTMFSLGHSITLLAGVLTGVHVNPYLIDAIIGLSVVYKAFDNLDGFRTLFGAAPDTRLVVLVFGLFHGMGLATKLQELHLSHRGLLTNLISFNVGVEIGQLIALSLMLGLMLLWRRATAFPQQAVAANVLILTAGFLLMQYQLAGFFTHRGA
ncbi:MAG: HupE/UreJ family protein [Caulobacteraceae bacterium]|nr:HupE/UreJ family protein [Caulobacteraceae bacterium]